MRPMARKGSMMMMMLNLCCQYCIHKTISFLLELITVVTIKTAQVFHLYVNKLIDYL